MIKTTIYAHISKEDLYDKGVEIGLTREALDMFKYFNEVALEIEIDDDGVVREGRMV